MKLSKPACALALLALACPAFSQSGGPRTLPELKADVQERADRRAYPVSDLEPAEVKEALNSLKTLDRDEWAGAWSASSTTSSRTFRSSLPKRENSRWLPCLPGRF